MPILGLRRFAAGFAALTLVSAAAESAVAQPAQGETHGSLQGNDAASWINDPHMHAFYDLTVAAFAQGPGKVDVAAYEAKSFAIFRAFGASRGMDPAKMQDHLKLIPRQVVQIAKDDPGVLDSYKNFVDATFGPQ